MNRAILSNILLAILTVAVFMFMWTATYRFMAGARITTLLTNFEPFTLFNGFTKESLLNIKSILWKSFGISSIVTFALITSSLLFRNINYFGDARWAYSGEIKKASILEDSGVIFGKYRNKYLRTDQAIHYLLAAPTRSGKGVGFVIPNLLSWPDSVVVLDIKHENYEITSGFRKKNGQSVFNFSPLDSENCSHCFNPLDELRRDVHRITDIQKLAVILLPTDKKGDVWTNEARDLFVGLVLLILDVERFEKTIGQIYRILKSDMELSEYIDELFSDNTITLDNNCHMSLSSFKNKAIKERSGVRSSLVSALNLWSNPVLNAATSKSDFTFKDLRKKRTSIYIGCKVNQLKTLAPLINLFFQQCIDSLSESLPQSDEPYKVLMIIDEFASLGKMETIETGLAVLAGYNIRIALIIQGLGQLKLLYKEGTESFLQNTAIKVFYAANDEVTSKYVSQKLGKKTIRTRTKSSQGGYDVRGSNISTSSTVRDFMLPEEFARLDEGKQIIFKEYTRPVIAQKIIYYKDNEFKKRILPAPEVPTLKIRDYDLIKSRNPESELNKNPSIESEIAALLEED